MKCCDGAYIIIEAVTEAINKPVSHICNCRSMPVLSENIIGDNLIYISLIDFSMYNSVLFKKYLWNGDHPFKTSAFLRGGGVKNWPNLSQDSSKKLLTEEGRGEKS